MGRWFGESQGGSRGVAARELTREADGGGFDGDRRGREEESGGVGEGSIRAGTPRTEECIPISDGAEDERPRRAASEDKMARA